MVEECDANEDDQSFYARLKKKLFQLTCRPHRRCFNKITGEFF